MKSPLSLRLCLPWLDRRAVTAIEYALIASLIAVVIVTAVRSMGNNLIPIFSKISSEL